MTTWTACVEGGPRRVNHAAVCMNGVIYSFGGYCTGDDFTVREDIDLHVYSTGENIHITNQKYCLQHGLILLGNSTDALRISFRAAFRKLVA